MGLVLRASSILLIFAHLIASSLSWDEIDETEALLPNRCHVCKYAIRELQEELERSGRSRDIFYTGQIFQKDPKIIKYKKSELRLTEALENACQSMLEYRVHKDKPVAIRYEKVESSTFQALRGLKDRGVKVELGFPDEMWDSPDAEVTRLKARCEWLVEQYEQVISDWYHGDQKRNLTRLLCEETILKPDERDCLKETADDETKTGITQEKDKSDVPQIEEDVEETDADEKRKLLEERDRRKEEKEQLRKHRKDRKKPRKKRKNKNDPERMYKKRNWRPEGSDEERMPSRLRAAHMYDSVTNREERHEEYEHGDQWDDQTEEWSSARELRSEILGLAHEALEERGVSKRYRKILRQIIREVKRENDIEELRTQLRQARAVINNETLRWKQRDEL